MTNETRKEGENEKQKNKGIFKKGIKNDRKNLSKEKIMKKEGM